MLRYHCLLYCHSYQKRHGWSRSGWPGCFSVSANYIPLVFHVYSRCHGCETLDFNHSQTQISNHQSVSTICRQYCTKLMLALYVFLTWIRMTEFRSEVTTCICSNINVQRCWWPAVCCWVVPAFFNPGLFARYHPPTSSPWRHFGIWQGTLHCQADFMTPAGTK